MQKFLVIAAGSLLDFTLINKYQYSIPVGRITNKEREINKLNKN